MPARTFRVFLSNNTDHCLVRTSFEVHGEWTSGEWTPPPTIPPRSERGWQSESNLSGLAPGTGGSVEYRPRAQPDPLLGGGHADPCTTPELADLIKITWNNPFLNFEGKLATRASGEVSVGSDFDKTSFDLAPTAFNNAGAPTRWTCSPLPRRCRSPR